MEDGRILIVDDEPEMLVNCQRLLSREGHSCTTLNDPSDFLRVFRDTEPDVVLSDLRMPGVDGMRLLAAARSEDPDVPFVLITAYATVSSAVQAIQEGAFDYLAKPFTAQQLAVAVRRALRQRRLTQENRELRSHIARQQGVVDILGQSPAIMQVIRRIDKVAASDADVFVFGESGTGKELVARSIHKASQRRNRPFVAVDCAAIPGSLLESTLFGHEKGAFTGAVARQHGLLEQADHGTLFFDEITELDAALQARLLRALQEREVRRVGGHSVIKLDVRVIAATNLNPIKAVENGRLREDLYYRLNVVPIHVPLLRERGSDVVLLFKQFVERFAEAHKKRAPELSRSAWDAIESYGWPGNVRELKNAAQQLVILSDGQKVTVGDLPSPLGTPPTHGHASASPVLEPYRLARERVLREFEAAYANEMLRNHDGNVTRAAEAAGVSRRTMHRWLQQLKSKPGSRRP
jgi:DNA-binding NtrC family response regulator